jgi:Uma2 family endonuclease
MGMSLPPTAPTPSAEWTADELWAFTERQPSYWQRYELVDGELLVSPSPGVPHHDVQQEIAVRLHAYLKAQRIGRLFQAPADLRVALGNVVQPDLSVVPWTPGTPRPRQWSDIARVLLTIEILSPSTARHDRLVKRRFYARMQIPEYWIVDPDTRLVERCLPDGRAEVLGDALRWHPEGAAEPFVLELPAFFDEALGKE